MTLDLFAGIRVRDYEKAGAALHTIFVDDPDGNEIGFGGAIDG